MTIETSATVVVVAALITALATGLGAVPFLFVARLAHSAIGVANALAAGFMLAASGLLFYEGAGADASLTVAGAFVGVLFVALASRLLAARPDVHFEALASADARKALLLVGVMTVHSFAEGVGVGVSFGGGQSASASSRRWQSQSITSLRASRSASFSSLAACECCTRPAGASSLVCRNRWSHCPHSRSSHSSTISCPSASASPVGQCCGWSSPRSSPTPCERARETGGRRGACWLDRGYARPRGGAALVKQGSRESRNRSAHGPDAA